jgi:hypothetical protein
MIEELDVTGWVDSNGRVLAVCNGYSKTKATIIRDESPEDELCITLRHNEVKRSLVTNGRRVCHHNCRLVWADPSEVVRW